MLSFLFKCTLLIISILILVAFFFSPASSNQDSKEHSEQSALLSIQDSINDLKNFCDRNSQLCETSKSLFTFLSTKVKEGARISYSFLESNFNETESDSMEKKRP